MIKLYRTNHARQGFLKNIFKFFRRSTLSSSGDALFDVVIAMRRCALSLNFSSGVAAMRGTISTLCL
jgi:hypothetical protein